MLWGRHFAVLFCALINTGLMFDLRVSFGGNFESTFASLHYSTSRILDVNISLVLVPMSSEALFIILAQSTCGEFLSKNSYLKSCFQFSERINFCFEI